MGPLLMGVSPRCSKKVAQWGDSPYSQNWVRSHPPKRTAENLAVTVSVLIDGSRGPRRWKRSFQRPEERWIASGGWYEEEGA
jgi:hypothetical protein